MKILISSHVYWPSVGGIEMSSRVLARQFQAMGHEVTLVTQTSSDQKEEDDFCIIRRPSFSSVRRLIKSCDVFWHNNISLRTAPYFEKTPWFITHQTWLDDGKVRARSIRLLKEWQCGRAMNFTLSHAMTRALPFPSHVIGNPYDDTVFRLLDCPRERDLVFVGRLVSDKGLDVLLYAMQQLKKRSLYSTLTVVGEGPEMKACKKMAETFGLTKQIHWSGTLRGHALAEVLNKHRICVVPSRWREPFGIVALEAIACGCFVVGSAQGGLPEAIGECGAVFANGDSTALAEVLTHAISQNSWTIAESKRINHLTRFAPHAMAKEYLQFFSGEKCL